MPKIGHSFSHCRIIEKLGAIAIPTLTLRTPEAPDAACKEAFAPGQQGGEHF
jgi:hypothetical protein